MELSKSGYYINENDNLLIVHPKEDSITPVEVYVQRKGRPERWELVLYNEHVLGMVNKAIEFDYIGEL